jgi:hypothetical protein
MNKLKAVLLSLVLVFVLLFGVFTTTTFATVVSSWSTIFFSTIRSDGYDINGNAASQTEILNESIFLPSTVEQHYKNTAIIGFSTGSNTMDIYLDDVALTSNNMTRTYAQGYDNTFHLYYWVSTLRLFDLQSIVDPDISVSRLEIMTHDPTNYSNISSNILTINWYDVRPSAPTTPTFIYNDPNNPGKAALTGVDTTMQYRLASNPSGWTAIEGSSVVFDIPATDTLYYVRYISPQSKVRKLTMKATPAAPSVTLDTATEAFTGLSTTMEMKINDGPYFPVTNDIITAGATPYINDIAAGTTATVSIRRMASETSGTSLPRVITLYPRAATPTGIAFNPITGYVSGLNATMQYRVQGSTSWTNITGASLDVRTMLSATSDVILGIRVKPVDGSLSASLPVLVTLPQLQPGPSLSLDLGQELITGFDSAKSYQYNTTGSATTWTTVPLTNNAFNIYSLLLTYQYTTIYIREAATSTVPATAATLFTAPVRPAAPTSPAFIYNDVNNPDKAVLTGINSGMEYRLSTGTLWTSCADEGNVFDLPSATVTYYVRIKGQGTTVTASQNKSLSLYPRGGAPSVTLNTTTETIGPMTASLEMSFDGINFTRYTSGVSEYSVSDLIDATLSGSTDIYIRTATTVTMPASNSKLIQLFPRSTSPTGITYNPITCIISGLTNYNYIQCRLPGATTWLPIGAATLNADNLNILSAAGPVIIDFRYVATSRYSASLPTHVTLDQLPAAPALTLDLEHETVNGCVNGVTYQYVTAAMSMKSVVAANNSIDISSAIQSGFSVLLRVRKAGTATQPATAYVEYAISSRGAAPPVPTILYNNPDYPDKAVMTNVNTTMEYKVGTQTQWTTCAANIVAINLTQNTYSLRYKGIGSTTPASNYVSFNVLTPAVGPAVIYNSTTEMLTGLQTSMEINMNQAGYTPVTTTTMSCSDLVTALTSGTTMELRIRVKATASAPASQVRIIMLYPRAAQPAGLTYNGANKTITGVSTAMQYRAAGTTTWNAISTATLSVSTLLTSGVAQVEVRYKPVENTMSASLPVVVDIY